MAFIFDLRFYWKIPIFQQKSKRQSPVPLFSSHKLNISVAPYLDLSNQNVKTKTLILLPQKGTNQQ